MISLEKNSENFKEVDYLLEKLEEEKNTITKKLYNYERKRLSKYKKEQSKQIKKEERIQNRLNKESK